MKDQTSFRSMDDSDELSSCERHLEENNEEQLKRLTTHFNVKLTNLADIDENSEESEEESDS